METGMTKELRLAKTTVFPGIQGEEETHGQDGDVRVELTKELQVVPMILPGMQGGALVGALEALMISADQLEMPFC